MKKVLLSIISLLLVVSLMGCGAKKQEDTKKQDDAKWSVSVEGANDKTAFTSTDYDKIGTVDIDATMKKKDGTEKKQKWTGIPMAKVIEALGVKEYSKITIEGKDGYNKEYTADDINASGTILAIKADGKELGDAGPVELIMNGKGSNWWIKSVTKIKITK